MLIVFLPGAGRAAGHAVVPKDKEEWLRYITLAVTIAVLALSVLAVLDARLAARSSYQTRGGGRHAGRVQRAVDSLVRHRLLHGRRRHQLAAGHADRAGQPAGDGRQLVDHQVREGYCILFLLLETGMLGVFLALDFFLFYVFWEVMLLPMYFLIGVWGGPRREYAAIKFFLYTLVGSVLMLIAILMLYFASDLTDPALRPHLGKCGLTESVLAQADAGRTERLAGDTVAPVHTFNLLALAQIGQQTTAIAARTCSGGRSCCCSSASSSRCRRCRCTPGCPTRTSRPRRRSR